MQVIDRVKSKKNVCRHCIANRTKYMGIWGIFFDDAPRDRLNFIDHYSSDKYWFITQPYGYQHIIKEMETDPIIQYSESHGVNIAIIPEGYHNKSAIVIIFYIENIDIFRKTINTILNRHNKYETDIRIDLTYFWFDKAYVRRMINHEYIYVPKPEQILQSAIDFLTWSDLK